MYVMVESKKIQLSQSGWSLTATAVRTVVDLKKVEEPVELAWGEERQLSLRHATACIASLDAGKLAEALTYCSAPRVDPPQCSLTAESPAETPSR